MTFEPSVVASVLDVILLSLYATFRLLTGTSAQGKPNDLIERIRNSQYFQPIWEELDDMMKPELYIGRSVQIVDTYCGPNGPVEKALAPYQKYISGSATAELNGYAPILEFGIGAYAPTLTTRTTVCGE
jgi:hypothetical protein